MKIKLCGNKKWLKSDKNFKDLISNDVLSTSGWFYTETIYQSMKYLNEIKRVSFPDFVMGCDE